MRAVDFMAAAGRVLDGNEVEASLSALGEADLNRIRLAARYLAPLASLEADDLIQEAFQRVLAGERKWPAGLSASHFVVGVMRSVVSAEAKRLTRRSARAQIETVATPPDVPAEGLGADELLVQDEEGARIRSVLVAALDGDEAATTIVDGDALGMSATDLQALTELDDRAYATKRKWIRRRLAKLRLKDFVS